MTGEDLDGNRPRRGDVEALRRWLVPNPGLSVTAITVARTIHLAAAEVLAFIPADSDELAEGLRKLLEAKDCLVRAALTAELAHAVAAEIPYRPYQRPGYGGPQ